MTIKVYKKDSDNRTLYLYEGRVAALDTFHCNCKNARCTYTLIDKRLPRILAEIRAKFGSDIIVTSAYRCQAHNAKVGGFLWSYHLTGGALDLFPVNGDTECLRKLMNGYFDDVVIYTSFVHGELEQLKE